MIYSLTDLTAEEVDTLAKGLAELPWKVAAPLMNKLIAQVRAQEVTPQMGGAPQIDPGAAPVPDVTAG